MANVGSARHWPVIWTVAYPAKGGQSHRLVGKDGRHSAVEEEFTVRKREFICLQAAIIKPFAWLLQGSAQAEIAVGQKPRLLLSAPERGARRMPFTSSARRIAAPPS